ncbi:hypothetical protein IJT93_07860 [bacterium]|nr:hypothetical protein [bacterium]
MINYKISNDYFKNREFTFNIGCGIFFLLWIFSIALIRDSSVALIFAVLLTIAVYYMYKPLIVDDKTYDDNAAKPLNNFKSKALNELDIDETEVEAVQPIELKGYTINGAGKAKYGKDGVLRTDRFSASITFFSNEAMHIYSFIYSTTTPNDTHESTKEYFYKDIVSIEITQRQNPIKTNLIQSKDYIEDCLTFITTGGSRVELSIAKQELESVKTSLKAMRNLLKEKKK